MGFLIGRLKDLINGLKVSRQLYMVYFLAGLLPILLVGGYLVLNTRFLLLNHYYEQASADNLRVRNIVLDVTTMLNNFTDEIFNDSQLQTLLKDYYPTLEDSYAACRSYQKMNSYAINYTEVSSITLYVNNFSISDHGNFKRTTPEVRETEWYQRAANSVGNYLWMTRERADTGGTISTELTLVRKIPIFGTSKFAVLVIGVNPNYLKSRIDTSPLKTEIMVNASPVFYSTIRGHNGQLPKISMEYMADHFYFSGVSDYDGNTRLLQISTIKPVKCQDNIYIMTIDSNALPALDRITLICVAIVVFSLLATIGMVGMFSHVFSDRINTLRREMHKVTCGDFNIIDDFRGGDELTELFTDLKTMIESIKHMDAEIYDARISRQKLINHQQEIQFEMLASQINPHFLYNTLETIRMKAHNAGDKEVANAIKLLGKSMRRMLEMGGKPVTLSSELDYIRIYLEIQRLRFTDRLAYEIIVDGQINPERHRVLPLLLQPIVENAIVHGLEDTAKGGMIKIFICRNRDVLEISVEDNGAGMQKKELEELLERMNRERTSKTVGGIGLYNILQRIVLYYGEDYGVTITSTHQKGTCVTATLPYSYTFCESEQGKELTT